MDCRGSRGARTECPHVARIRPMPLSLVRRHVIVTGRVQGVWFRDSVRAVASEHGVAGWVRNRSDGSVEAVFEGAEPDVIELLVFCREGPPRAHVLTMSVGEESPEGLQGFEVHSGPRRPRRASRASPPSRPPPPP